MATSLPQITTSRVDDGWLNTCSCGHETWHIFRHAADYAAYTHRASHARHQENR